MSSAMLKKKRTVFNPESSPMMDADSIDDQLSLMNSVFCMKVSYSFYNVILMLFGVLAIGVGVWSFFSFFRINLLLCSNYYSIVCLMLIISGMLVLFFLFVIGCYGSFHDSYPCWNFFSFGLMFVFLINLAISCSVIKYKLMISKDLLKFLEHNMNSYKSKYLGTRNAFDAMHRKFRCCGINSFSDWFSSDAFLNTTSVVPDSCCISESVNCGVRNHPSNIYYEGCSKFLDTSLQQQLAIIGLTSSILCCIQLSGVMLSCCLVKKRKGIHIIHH